MKFFQQAARFPSKPSDVPKAIVDFIAKQLKLPSDMFHYYSWNTQTSTNHRNEIRKLFGFREDTLSDEKEITEWLQQKVFDHSFNSESLGEMVYMEYRNRKIETPTHDQIIRMVKSAIWNQKQQFYQDTYQKLSSS